mmetsp:Transcript_49255/g.122377  ORF Transcript_49255/g.122377 Transcript_49255/m.122377 type:complete len:82 (-) Transcript_49255:177-422(-)
MPWHSGSSGTANSLAETWELDWSLDGLRRKMHGRKLQALFVGNLMRTGVSRLEELAHESLNRALAQHAKVVRSCNTMITAS